MIELVEGKDFEDEDTYTMCGGEVYHYLKYNMLCGKCKGDTFRIIKMSGGCVCNDYDDYYYVCVSCGERIEE